MNLHLDEKKIDLIIMMQSKYRWNNKLDVRETQAISLILIVKDYLLTT